MSPVGTLGLRPMRPRDPDEPHRVSSTLELFFDLTFAVAISVAAEQLAAFQIAGAVGNGTVAYLLVFFGVWWAWMNYTWFASAFATDEDWFYRLLTIVVMAGVLVFAAGIPQAMQHLDFRVGTAGYVLMRLAGVTQWLRASRSGPFRRTAIRYAVGVGLVQAGWLLRLLVPAELAVVSFIALVVAELAVPPWAERTGVTPFHPRHIAERYGLFTLIVLGEGLLAVTHATIAALENAAHLGPLLVVAASALVLIAGMWWIYFAREQHENLTSLAATFGFGYLHYAVFASAGALAAGIEVALAQAGDSPPLPPALGRATTTVPVGVFLLVVWVLALRPALPRRTSWLVLLLTLGVVLTALLPAGLPVAAALVVAVVVVLEVDGRRRRGAAPAES